MKNVIIVALAIIAIAGLVLMFTDHMTIGMAMCGSAPLISSLITLRTTMNKKEQ